MQKLFICMIEFLILFSGCTTTVNLVLKTNDKVNHSAKIAIKNKSNVTKKELDCGIVTSKKNNSFQFTIKKNEVFQVKSSLVSGNAIIYSSPDIAIDRKMNPFTYEIELKTPGKSLDDSLAIKTISASLDKTGGYIGATPKSIKDAVENIMGSLIVVVNDPVTKKNTIKYTVSPDKLGGRKMTLEDIRWKNTSLEGETIISGSSANKVKTAIPMIAKFDAAFDNKKIYNLRWTMQGYGEHLKPEDRDVSPTELIMKLLFNDLEHIKLLVEKNGARVFYVNQVYVLKNAELFIKEAQNIEKTEKGTASVIWDNMVYTFDNSEEIHFSYGEQVLNFWGNEYSFTFEKGDVYKAHKLDIDYKITYSIYNMNKRMSFAPDIFD